MREIREKYEGDLVVEQEEVRVFGLIAGNLVLRMGAEVIVQGMVCGNVDVEAGDLILHGTVNGDVVNRGGVIHIYGSIHGRVHEMSGITKVSPDAVIRA
jgi:cytoskeletal protein CcmA (bactofilin family)